MAVLDCNNIKLQRNSKGENVKTLQNNLKTLGYYTKSIDGDYGYYTQEAVKSFQKAYKLAVDGWVGPVTCKKLSQVINEKEKQQNNQNEITFDCPKTSLKRNSKGDQVKKLQTMLKALGYYTSQIDGDFGVYTEQAVKAFQKANGHDPDGWFGPKTCPTLVKIYNNKVGNNKTDNTPKELTLEYMKQVTSKLTVLPSVVVLPESEFDTTTGTKKVTEGSIVTETNFDCPKTSLKRNSKGDQVKKLQTMLKARGYYTREVDGDFGPYTQEAVIKLQRQLGVKTDGWFGQETCKKLQSTTNTGEEKNKNTNYVITDFKSVTTSDDIEGLSHEVTVQTPYTLDKMKHVRKLQKTQFDMYLDNDVVYNHEGYISDIKITQEDDTFLLELSMVGYTVFLDQQLEFEKTAKRSELIKEICELAGLKAEVDTTGLDDSEYTVKVQKASTKTAGDGAGGLTQMSGNDCTDTWSLSAYSFDINTCKGGTKIGNSTANYAVDTANMTAKEALQDLFRRFKYGLRGSGKGYANNKYCPQSMWNKNGTIWGNCADAARLTKALMEVHGLKVGIHHWSSGNIGHYFNVIEIDGKTYRYDCCFGSKGYSEGYGNELCNNLTKNGGPWTL